MTKKKRLEQMGISGERVSPRKKIMLNHFQKQEQEFLRKINKLQSEKDALEKLRSDKEYSSIMDDIESLTLRQLINLTKRNKGRKPTGRRWTKEEKLTALAIFKRGPRAYRYLSYLIMLPSVRTIQELLRSIPLEPGLSLPILRHLKKCSEKMTVQDRQCILMFDEISLKKRLIYNENARRRF